MKVHWTDNSIANLLDIFEYISHDSPIYAKQIIDRITRRSEQITSFPASGRMVPEYEAENIREIIEKPYRIIYQIKSDQIDVLTVVHCAKLLLDKYNEDEK